MTTRMRKRWIQLMLLLVILGLGATFRFSSLNWDSNSHIHPDERFLTMVAQDLKFESFASYLKPEESSLNPDNAGYDFYVYGTWPLIVAKATAVWLSADTYNGFTLVGRALSALADWLVIGLVFLLGKLMADRFGLGKLVPYFAALSYGLMVLPIQLSHFFAVDPFLTLFMTASAAASVWGAKRGKWIKGWLAGVFWGMALATKISAAFGLPIVLFWLALPVEKQGMKERVKELAWLFFIFGAGAYLAARVAAPAYFENPSFFNPLPSRDFLQDLGVLKSYENPDGWFPPGVQWLHKPPMSYALINMALFGLGLPMFWLIAVGIVFLIIQVTKTGGRGRWLWLSLLVWSGGFFLFQASQFVKALRYFYFLYPFMALMAGFGWQKIWEMSRTKLARVSLSVIVFCLLLGWPLAFMSIYFHDHSRVEASRWIYRNIPSGSSLLSEHWDDALPLMMPNEDFSQYQIEQLPVFEWDSSQKWEKMDELLAKGDYLILSSNRGWGSMPTDSQKYPDMTLFYHRLFTGQSEYELIQEFSSYPSLEYLGVPLTLKDDWADETFTVYDHPKVMIFKRL